MVCRIVFGCVLDYSDPYDTNHQPFRIHDSELRCRARGREYVPPPASPGVAPDRRCSLAIDLRLLIEAVQRIARLSLSACAEYGRQSLASRSGRHREQHMFAHLQPFPSSLGSTGIVTPNESVSLCNTAHDMERRK